MALESVIEIKDLVVWARHGVLEKEKQLSQEFRITLRATIDGSLACASDRVGDTIDYSALSKQIHSLVQETCFDLIESLAYQIALVALGFSVVSKIFVKVKKMKPPMPYDVAYAAVEISLDRLSQTK